MSTDLTRYAAAPAANMRALASGGIGLMNAEAERIEADHSNDAGITLTHASRVEGRLAFRRLLTADGASP